MAGRNFSLTPRLSHFVDQDEACGDYTMVGTAADEAQLYAELTGRTAPGR
jgi:hypothetical protein